MVCFWTNFRIIMRQYLNTFILGNAKEREHDHSSHTGSFICHLQMIATKLLRLSSSQKIKNTKFWFLALRRPHFYMTNFSAAPSLRNLLNYIHDGLLPQKMPTVSRKYYLHQGLVNCAQWTSSILMCTVHYCSSPFFCKDESLWNCV